MFIAIIYSSLNHGSVCKYYGKEIPTFDNHFNAKLDKYVSIYKYVKCNYMLQVELGRVYCS